MDPISQGLLGAAVAQSAAPPEEVRRAGLLGALAGMAPDLDVLIRSSEDPLLFLEYHRQFTHSLAFVPVGALACAGVLFWLVRGRMTFARTYGFCFLGYLTHGLLDACTSYGTQLLWPFSDVRVAWNNVSVVDPLLTLPALVLVGGATLRRRPTLARVALLWIVLYLGFGVVQRERAEMYGEEVARSRAHAVPRGAVLAKPAFGNVLLWKTVYEWRGRYYVDAVRLGTTPRAFYGESVPRLDAARDLPWLRDGSRQAEDLERFRWFSDGYLALDPDRANHVIDVRYSMVPNEIGALWGIQLVPGRPLDAPAAFYTDRRSTPEVRAKLARMLFD